MPTVEVCLRVVDKVNIDSYLDAGCTKSGDVIEILPVGSDWGSEVWGSVNYRILRITAAQSFINSLLAIEPGSFVGRLPRKRRYKTNIGVIPQPYRNRILADQAYGEVVDLTGVDLSPYVTVKDLL